MRNLLWTLCLFGCAAMVRAADPPPANPPPTPIQVQMPGVMPSYGPGMPRPVTLGTPPPGCELAQIPRAGAKSPADLSGTLPVADYLDSLFDCADLQFGSMPRLYKPKNLWLENETQQYSEILARQKFPWLVMPVQTQFYGFDRIERALMSAEIAEIFAGQGAAPDTLLVARALGEVRRRYEPAASMSLANAIGASRVLEGYAGHDGANRMTLTMFLKECRGIANCRVLTKHDWRAIPFSDDQPPFQVIRTMRAALLREMVGVSGPGVAKAASRPFKPGDLDLKGLASGHARADFATIAGLLASLSPGTDELGRDRQYVIALRAALRDEKSPSSRVLAGLAAHKLHRRPYALRLIDGLQDPAAVTLRALLDGNLTEALQALPAVKSPPEKLMLSFAVQDMRLDYGRKGAIDLAAAQEVFGNATDQWGALIMNRAGDRDGWVTVEPDATKQILDLAFPAPGQDLKSLLKGARVVGDEFPDQKFFDLANIKHLRTTLGTLRPADCCAAGGPNASWQLYWLLESRVEAGIIDSVSFLLDAQGRPADAMQRVADFEDYYAGQPDFEVLRFRVGNQVQKQAPKEMLARLGQQNDAAELSAAYWSQGQNDAALRSALRRGDTMIPREAYSKDFPPRSSWSPVAWMPGESKGACTVLRYSVRDVMPAITCLMSLPPDKQTAMRAELAGRFHGNPTAAAQLNQAMPAGASADRAADLRAAIAQDPETWENYRDLGLLLLQRDGNYAEAQKTYLAYPEFKVKSPDEPVRVANAAYEVGSELFWRGRHELARPLFEIAANLHTGSNASMTGAIRLAILDGDFEAAAEGSMQRGARYPNPYAYRDYFSLLYALGEKQDADAGFTRLAASFDNPSMWVADLVGQRMQPMSHEQFKTWILGQDIRDAHHRGLRYAPIYALWWATTDRKPTADFARVMAEIERGAKRPMEMDGQSLLRPVFSGEGSNIIRPSALRAGKSPKLPPDSNAKSEYVLLADALVAHHAGDHASAVQKFIALADRYPIEEGDYAVALGYFALSAAKTGDKVGLEKFIESLPEADYFFDVWLARAHFAAVRRDADKAVRALGRAFNVRPHTDSRPIISEYQFAESCEIVYRETGDARALQMLLDWAKRHQRIQPSSAWAYSMEAAYSKIPIDVNRALAMTLYLDPASPRIAKFDVAKIAAARAWLKANNPFLKSAPHAPQHGVQLRIPRASAGR